MKEELKKQMEEDKRRAIAKGLVKRQFDGFDNFVDRMCKKSLVERESDGSGKMLCIIYGGMGSGIAAHNIGIEEITMYISRFKPEMLYIKMLKNKNKEEVQIYRHEFKSVRVYKKCIVIYTKNKKIKLEM